LSGWQDASNSPWDQAGQQNIEGLKAESGLYLPLGESQLSNFRG